MKRIAIFLPNWVGDVVMATPALRALREHFRDKAVLVGVMRPYVTEVLAGTSWLDQVLVYDRRSAASVRRLIGQLREEQLDAILLLTNSFSTGLIAWLSGTPNRIGYAMDGRRCLLTDRIIAPRDERGIIPHSAVDHYLNVIRVIAPVGEDKSPALATTAVEEELAGRVWRDLGWQSEDRVVVLNTGGAYGAAKTWPDEHFGQLARQLVDRWGVRVLVICGPAEREAARRICRIGDHRHIRSLADHAVGVGLSKACVRRAELMITTDSGPRHFASAFGVPVVTIFGPTDPRWSHNYHPLSIDVQHSVPCAPCAQRVCPLQHHRCMRDLSVEKVVDAVAQLLARCEREKAA